MREYEVTVLLRPDMEEEAQKELTERIEGWLTQSDDEAAKPVASHWGRRRMAYPIRKFTDSYYLYFEAMLEPARVSEIERNMQYVDDILRYLVIRKEN